MGWNLPSNDGWGVFFAVSQPITGPVSVYVCVCVVVSVATLPREHAGTHTKQNPACCCRSSVGLGVRDVSCRARSQGALF